MTYQLSDDDRAAIEMAREADQRTPAYDDHGLSISLELGGAWPTAYTLGLLAGFALAREAAARAVEMVDGTTPEHIEDIRALTLAGEVEHDS